MNKKRILKSLFLSFLFVFSFFAVSGSISKVEAASKDEYVIKVNKKMNTVTVYKNDIPIKAMPCSVGKTGNTPVGTFRTSQKMRWHTLFGQKKGTYVYGQYCTRFNNHFIFHSVCYDKYKKPNTLNVTEYRKLGTAASKGCVRLTVEDAKWIYKNCPLKTKVIVYNSSSPGPLGKPSVPTILKSNKSGWDPTDTNKESPYYKKRPTITISKEKKTSITVGDSYDLMEGVTAKSYKKEDITSRIEVVGKVNTKKPGKYLLTYRVQDKKGNYRSKEFWVTVKKAKAPVLVGYQSTLKLKLSGSSVSKKITALDKDGTSLTSKLKISYSSKYGSVVKKSKNKVTFKKPGTYTITYKVKGLKKNGAVTTKKKMKVIVLDNALPSINNKTERAVITAETAYGREEILKGVTAKTKWSSLTSKITYKINGKNQEAVDTSKAGTYVIEYHVKSEGGKKAEPAERTLIVEETESAVHPEETNTTIE